MAFTYDFWDSFDNYNDLTQKWDGHGIGSDSIDLTGNIATGGRARTGIGCCLIGAAFGPYKNIGQTAQPWGWSGFFIPNAPPSDALGIQWFEDTINGQVQVRLAYNADLSVSIWAGNNVGSGSEIARGAPGKLIPAAYNFIWWKVFINAAGSALVYVNGSQALSASNINTNPTASGFVNRWRLMGRGGADPTGGDRHDDPCTGTWSANGDIISTTPGIYSAVPVSDSTPLQWTPSTGVAHWPLVSSIPPDLTKWVQTATSGNVDQYIHAIPVNEQVPVIPGSPLIIAAQHVLLCRTDSNGVRRVTSDVGGVASSSDFALSQSWHQFATPYATNPATGLAWQLTDLATTALGPKCTA